MRYINNYFNHFWAACLKLNIYILLTHDILTNAKYRLSFAQCNSRN